MRARGTDRARRAAMTAVLAVCALALAAPPAAVARQGLEVPVGTLVLTDADTTLPALTGGIVGVNPDTGLQELLARGGSFADPFGIVQTEDQVYVITDQNAFGGAGGIIEVDLRSQVADAAQLPVPGNGQRVVASAATAQFVPPAAQFENPAGIVQDAQKNFFVADPGTPGAGAGGKIFHVQDNPTGTSVVTLVSDGADVTKGPVMADPIGIAMEADGSLLVADPSAGTYGPLESAGTVFRIDPQTGQRTVLSTNQRSVDNGGGDYFADPEGVTVGPDGIYVADAVDLIQTSAGAVLRIDPVTGAQTVISSSGNFARPISTSPAPGGKYYVLDSLQFDIASPTGDRGAVFRIDPAIAPSQTQEVVTFNAWSGGLSFNRKYFANVRMLVTAAPLLGPPDVAVQDEVPSDVSDVAVPESQDATFTVTLSRPSTRLTTMDWSTADQTATAGSDYVAASGSLSFAPGETIKTVTIDVLQDEVDEPDETFELNLTNLFNASIGDVQGIGKILDDDAPPVASTPDTTVPEPGGGTVNAHCPVNLSAVSARTVTVSYATSDGTAVAPADYTAASGVVTIPAGLGSVDIPIVVNSDFIDELDETFNVTLSSEQNATLGKSTCVVTIADSNPVPTLTVKDSSVQEGHTGLRDLTFPVTLSGLSSKLVRVNWTSFDVSADDSDYVPATGSLVISPGSTTGSIVVQVRGDRRDESDETFSLRLDAVFNAVPASTQAVGTILDDDDPPLLPPSGVLPEGPVKSSGTPKAKVCKSRRTFRIRVKKTKRRRAKVISATVFVNGRKVTTRRGKRLTAPVILRGLKKGRYRVVVKAKLSDGRTVTDVRRYYTCRKKIVKKKRKR